MMYDQAAELLDRTARLVENRMPELASDYMRVPLSYYTSEDSAARERQLFLTQPLPLIAASEIAEPDSYFVRTAMGRSVLLTRDGEGKAHAFLNYCRHRGGEVAEGCGKARRFFCPYHAWNYNNKGELVAMPLADRNSSLDYSKHGLVELPSEERHGLIWVVLTPAHSINVAAHLGEADAYIAAIGLDRMKYYNALPHEPLATNWKCAAEGLVETIHVPYVHRMTFGQDPANSGDRFNSATAVDLAIYDRFGPHLRYVLPLYGPKGLPDIRKILAEGGEAPPGTTAQVWLLSPGILIAQELYGFIFADLEPGTTVNSSLFRFGWMSPFEKAPAAGLPSPTDMADRARRAVKEDAPVWAGCHRGFEHGGHDYALIGKNEKGVQIFHEALADQTGYEGLSYI